MEVPLRDVDWRIIAEQASKEMDPQKLTRLVAELCRSLDDRNRKTEQENPAADTEKQRESLEHQLTISYQKEKLRLDNNLDS
jgi:hypothetical protein